MNRVMKLIGTQILILGVLLGIAAGMGVLEVSAVASVLDTMLLVFCTVVPFIVFLGLLYTDLKHWYVYVLGGVPSLVTGLGFVFVYLTTKYGMRLGPEPAAFEILLNNWLFPLIFAIFLPLYYYYLHGREWGEEVILLNGNTYLLGSLLIIVGVTALSYNALGLPEVINHKGGVFGRVTATPTVESPVRIEEDTVRFHSKEAKALLVKILNVNSQPIQTGAATVSCHEGSDLSVQAEDKQIRAGEKASIRIALSRTGPLYNNELCTLTINPEADNVLQVQFFIETD